MAQVAMLLLLLLNLQKHHLPKGHQIHRLCNGSISRWMICVSLMLQLRTCLVQRRPSLLVGARAWTLLVPSVCSPSVSRGRRSLRILKTHQLRMDLRDQDAPEGLNATITTACTTTTISSPAPPLLTTALLRISYDGSRFTGWSSGNDKAATNRNRKKMNKVPPDDSTVLSARKRRRRRRRSGSVRSVQGVVQTNLAKLYGNVDPRRVIVEGCSRTDKGVHAVGMVAQFYCLTEEACSFLAASGEHQQQQLHYPEGQPSIPGKRAPHPWNATDTSCFVPLRQTDLSQLAFALNRMVCPDVQILAYAPTPASTTSKIPFHPTLAASRKAYRYQFSVGTLHDPTQCHYVWHVLDAAAAAKISTNHTSNDDDNRDDCWTARTSVQQACAAMQGRHDFSAFQGAPRGADDKRKRVLQDTVCSLQQVTLRRTGTWVHSSTTATYTLELTGDRFLYKMARFLAGAIVAVGRDQMTVADLERLLETGERTARDHAGGWECAPAHALQLHKVEYDDIEYPPIDWQLAMC